MQTNREFSLSDKRFREACERAHIPPTVRQASKWRLGFGKAWEHRFPEVLDEDTKLAVNE